MKNTRRALGIRPDGYKDVWQLVSLLKKKGLIKGYVLYSQENESLNPATVHAGIRDAVLIEESLRNRADGMGLQMLYDARNESQQACWQETGEKLNHRLVLAMKPQLAFNRDLAIAHRAMVYYGVDSVYREILSRAEPLTPVVGWNAGPESDHVAPPSEYALFNTASDYCSNLTFLSAGAREARLDKARRIDPRNIDFARREAITPS